MFYLADEFDGVTYTGLIGLYEFGGGFRGSLVTLPLAGMDFDPSGRLLGITGDGDIYDLRNFETSVTPVFVASTGLSGIRDITGVPEPSRALLSLAGIAAIGLRRRRS